MAKPFSQGFCPPVGRSFERKFTAVPVSPSGLVLLPSERQKSVKNNTLAKKNPLILLALYVYEVFSFFAKRYN